MPIVGGVTIVMGACHNIYSFHIPDSFRAKRLGFSFGSACFFSFFLNDHGELTGNCLVATCDS